MSQENVEIVRRLYDEWARGDFSTREPFGDELDFEIRGFPDSVRARGIDGMAKVWREQLQAWDEWRTSHIEELIEAGEHIVVFNRIWGRGRHSGAEVEAAEAALFTFRDGKIVRLLLTNREEALKAAGLSE